MKFVKIGETYVNIDHVVTVSPRKKMPPQVPGDFVVCGSIVVTTWERIETDLLPEQVVAILENAGVRRE